MKRFVCKYRAPLIAGVVLFAATWLWAWGQWTEATSVGRQEVVRHAQGLASGLAIAVELLDAAAPGNDAALREALESHVRLAQPFRFATVLRGRETVAELCGDLGDHQTPGRDPERHGPDESDPNDFLVVRLPLAGGQVPPPGGSPPPGSPGTFPGEVPHTAETTRASGPAPSWRGRPPGAPPQGPWHWLNAENRRRPDATTAGLELLVGLDTALPPDALARFIQRIATILALAWAGILALALAWSRSIRSRDLAAALDAERRERQRLAEMNLAAAGLAHETKNPLGIILGLAQRLAGNRASGPVERHAAEQIIDAADQATARLGDFINFARLPSPRLEEVRAAEVLERVVAILRPDFEDAGVQLVTSAPPLLVHCDPALLEQVLLNLLLNSLQASDAGTKTTATLVVDGDDAALTVADEGRGIPPRLLSDIFQPYVTGRSGGHGLGLAIVKRIVDHHGWDISVHSEVDGGTSFCLSGIRVASGGDRST